MIGKLGNFIKFNGKIPDILVLITGHFGLFKTPTLRLGEAGTIQTQSQTQRLRIAKTDFKSVRKTILVQIDLNIETLLDTGFMKKVSATLRMDYQRVLEFVSLSFEIFPSKCVQN